MDQLFIFIILTLTGVVRCETPLCSAGWEAYENEKCFKFVEETGLLSYESAESWCSQPTAEFNASLIDIKSAKEQNFIADYLFKTHNIVDTVWIGARNTSIAAKFKWSDSSYLTFTNWAVDSPSNKTNYDCVQMMPDSSPPGKWVDEPCNKRNVVVCQKLQVWSLFLIQKKLQELLKNSVPVGFIYVQLPNQPEPKQLWPELNWQHISLQYSGHFFRVEGGNAAEFGTSQLDAFQGHNHEKYVFNETTYGDYDYSGNGYHPPNWYARVGNKNLIFNDNPLSNGFNGTPRNASETRPVNYSVRVWKRIQ